MEFEDLFTREDISDMNRRFLHIQTNAYQYGPRGSQRIIPGDNTREVYNWEENGDWPNGDWD